MPREETRAGPAAYCSAVFTPFIERLLDRRVVPVRLAVMSASAVGYLVLLTGPGARPGPVDWAVAVGAVAVSAVAVRWPLACALGQAALLAVAEAVAGPGVIVVKVLAAFAMFELAMRRSGWPLWAGAASLAAVYTVVGLGHDADTGLAGLVYRVVVMAGAPLLLGVYVRGLGRRAARAEERAAEQERVRRSEVRVARVSERTAIARELHDLVAHHVASMVLRVGVARHVLPAADDDVRQVLDDVHATGTTALADLRRLVAVLRDPSAPETPGGSLVDPGELPAAIEAVVDRGRQVGLRVDVTVDPAITGLDAVRGLAVLRLIQEGLANVAKHAGPAAHARLSVRQAENGVRLELCDDGGEPGTGGSQGTGAGPRHGLVGMRERVELLGGVLQVGADGPGWRLSALLPAATEPADAEIDRVGNRR